MQFMRANRTDPEKIFMVFKNSYDTASLTNGQLCAVDYATDANGLGVTKPTARSTTHNGNVIAGVVAATIAAGAYGLVQVYGYHSAVRVRSATGGSPAIAAGRPLYNAAAAVFCAESARFICTTCSANTKVSVLSSIGFALAAQASWTTKAIAAFIKAL